MKETIKTSLFALALISPYIVACGMMLFKPEKVWKTLNGFVTQGFTKFGWDWVMNIIIVLAAFMIMCLTCGLGLAAVDHLTADWLSRDVRLNLWIVAPLMILTISMIRWVIWMVLSKMKRIEKEF